MGWLLDEIEIHTPIKGLSYYIKCDSWLAKDKSDGQISRVFNIDDASTQISTYKSRKWRILKCKLIEFFGNFN